MKYPIGIQSFEELKRGGYVYVDKTKHIHQLISTGKYYFLSRPRRFGKSLLMSTIEAYYKGLKDLFKGTYIGKINTVWEEHPVFHFDFNAAGSPDVNVLSAIIDHTLSIYESKYGVSVKSFDITAFPVRFMNVIYAAKSATGKNVVLLFDEYDKSLLKTHGNQDLQDAHRDILKPFYSVLKTMDSHIEFAMITGVARFGKVSIFSDLNNLADISMVREYNDICGISESEVEKYFSSSIKEFALKKGKQPDEIKNALRLSYDGYHFVKPEGLEGIYNPFSLINSLNFFEIEDYWFDTDTLTFLVKELIQDDVRFDEMNEVYATRDELMNVNVVKESPIGNLYQTGYLTIKAYDEDDDLYRLGFPNREVEHAFDTFTLKVYGSESKSGFDIAKMRRDISTGHPREFMKRLESFFADCPYDLIPDSEVHYQNIIYLLYKFLGYKSYAERKTSNGRIDLLVETRKYIYLFEFKINKSAEIALEQIDRKEYSLPFETDGRKVFKIGVNFDTKTRRIDSKIME